MLGRSVPTVMMQGFLLSDLPTIARLDSYAETDAALASAARRRDGYDLALVVSRSDSSDAVAFAHEMRRHLGAAAARSPFVVALAERLPPASECRARCSDACAACLQLPLSRERFTALLGALFRG